MIFPPYQSIYLSIYILSFFFLYPSIHLSISIISLSIHRSIKIISLYLSVYLSVLPHLNLSVLTAVCRTSAPGRASTMRSTSRWTPESTTRVISAFSNRSLPLSLFSLSLSLSLSLSTLLDSALYILFYFIHLSLSPIFPLPLFHLWLLLLLPFGRVLG